MEVQDALRFASPTKSNINFRRALSVLERVHDADPATATAGDATGSWATASTSSSAAGFGMGSVESLRSPNSRSGGGGRPFAAASVYSSSDTHSLTSGARRARAARRPGTTPTADVSVEGSLLRGGASDESTLLMPARVVPYELPSTRRYKGVSVVPGGGGGALAPKERLIHSLERSASDRHRQQRRSASPDAIPDASAVGRFQSTGSAGAGSQPSSYDGDADCGPTPLVMRNRLSSAGTGSEAGVSSVISRASVAHQGCNATVDVVWRRRRRRRRQWRRPDAKSAAKCPLLANVRQWRERRWQHGQPGNKSLAE